MDHTITDWTTTMSYSTVRGRIKGAASAITSITRMVGKYSTVIGKYSTVLENIAL